MTTRRIHIRQPLPGEIALSPAEQRVALREGVQARGNRFAPMRLQPVPAHIVRARETGGRHAL